MARLSIDGSLRLNFAVRAPILRPCLMFLQWQCYRFESRESSLLLGASVCCGGDGGKGIGDVTAKQSGQVLEKFAGGRWYERA